MTHYTYTLPLLTLVTFLLSGCGMTAVGKNSLAIKNNPIGTSEEIMKQQLFFPWGGSCNDMKIGVDDNDFLSACTYTITLSPSRMKDNFIYFYKGKYVGYGEKVTFISKFREEIQKEKNPLFNAIEIGDINEVKNLLANRSNPNVLVYGVGTPLIKAVSKGNEKIVKLLLENGADPNMKDNLGYYPLHIAADKNSINILVSLLKYGAKINKKATNDLHQGATPLMIAVLDNKIDIVKFLVANGADLNIFETKYGTTPFLQAALRKQYDMAEFLAKNGADTEIPDYKGITAQQYAVNTNDNRLLEITRFNPQLLTLENIEEQYDEELKTYQKRKEELLKDKDNYKEREYKFLNELTNKQLKMYSLYADNIKDKENPAKILLSFREFSGSLNKKEQDEFVQLYSINQNITDRADLIEKMDKNLIERKEIIDDLKEEIAKVEKQKKDEERQATELAFRNQQQIIATQNTQAVQSASNSAGLLSILAIGLNASSNYYNAKAASYRQFADSYESRRQNEKVVSSLDDIARAIRFSR